MYNLLSNSYLVALCCSIYCKANTMDLELDHKTLLVAPPVMPWREFADWIRMDAEKVRNWIQRGYLPTTKIGRYRMINVAQFVQSLLEEEGEV